MSRNLWLRARGVETTGQTFLQCLIDGGWRCWVQPDGRWRNGQGGVFFLPRAVWSAILVLALAPVVGAPCGMAAEKPKGDQPQTTVDLFAGIQQGQIEAKLVAKDFTACRLMITNKTDAPISVRLPDVFAGVPVLAAVGMPFPGINNQPNNNNRNQKAPQALGLASPFANAMNGPNGGNNGGPLMNVPGMQNNGNNRGGAWHAFNIPPEKVEKIKLKAVCLDHGRPAPTHATVFALKPLDAVVQQPEVYEICRMMAQETVSQRVAQAAVWHLVNNVSWKDLALSGVKALFGPDAGHSPAAEIQTAQRVLKQVAKTVKSHPQAQSAASASEQK